MNKERKTIGIYAHVDAGKTTLTEQLLYKTGAIKEVGKVDQGTSHTDQLALEQERGISITSTPIAYEYKGVLVNIIDTPGHVDFVAEVERSMSILDGAVLVISAKEGVQSHTVTLYQALKRLAVPTLIFINKVDRLGVNLSKLSEEIKDQLGQEICLLNQVEGEGSREARLVFGPYEENLVLSELLFEKSDLFAKAWLEESLTEDFMTEQMISLTRSCAMIPAIAGTAMHGLGIEALLDLINQFLPSFHSLGSNPSGHIFKIERYHAKVKECYVKLTGGHLAIRANLGEDKISKIKVLTPEGLVEKPILLPGELGLITGLHKAYVGMSFGQDQGEKKINLANPTLSVGINPQRPMERNHLLQALTILQEKDPYLTYQINELSGDINLNLFGKVQLEIIEETLWRDFGVRASFTPPQTIYQETLCQSARAQRHMYEDGLPFHAALGFRIRPLARGQGIHYVSEVSFGDLQVSYQNAVREGVYAYLDQGLKGWSLTDMEIVLDYYEYNSVSSTPKDYRNLAPLVLFEAIQKAETKLLWPRVEVELDTTIEVMGACMAEMSKALGLVADPIVVGNHCKLKAVMPLETSQELAQRIQELTGGFASPQFSAKGYEEVPVGYERERSFFKVSPGDRGRYLLEHLRAI